MGSPRSVPPAATLLAASLLVLPLLVLSSCSGGDGVDPPPPDNTPAQVVVSPAADTLDWINATRQLSAQVRNASGSPVGATVSWSSQNTSVVTVSSSGTVTAVAVGTAQVVAQAGSVSGTATITVRQVPAAVARTAGDGQSATAGGTLPSALEVTVTDQGGTGVGGVSLAWTVSSGGGILESSSSTTDGAGVGRAVWRLGSTVGAQLVQVAAGSLSATFTATATDPGGGSVIITGVTPSVLKEGASATMLGGGFSSVASQNQVTVDGLTATVSAATSTSLTFTVPASDCRPPHQGQLRVAVGGASANAAVAVTPDSVVSLEWGHGWYATDNCINLASNEGSERFLVGVLSTSETPSSLTPVRVTGVTGSAVQGRVLRPSAMSSRALVLPPEAAPPLRAAAAPLPWRAPSSSGVDWTAHRAAETKIRDAESRLLRSLDRASVPDVLAQRQTVSASVAAAVPAKGDTLTMNVPADASCSQGNPVRAVVRYVGTGGLWLEDVANPVQAFTDAEYASLDQFYSQTTAPVLGDYFGNFVDVDGNQRTVILLTKEVNRKANLLGFVWAGDLLPQNLCPTSNEAEIFYGQVPDPAGTVGTARTKDDVQASYPALVAHEITHVLQRTQTLYGNAGDKSRWQIEGGATLAEQLVGYQVLGHGSGQNLGAIEFWATGADDWYLNWASDLARYYGWSGSTHVAHAPEQCSWMGSEDDGNTGPCNNLRAVYGVPATFLRFVLDRYGPDYAGGEKALMRTLTASAGSGLDDIADVTGTSAVYTMVLFGITLGADGLVWNSLTSWNLYEIFQSFTESARLQPYISTATQPSLDVSVRAGSNAYLQWTTPADHAPTSLKARTPSGGTLPGHMVLWVLRIQ